MRKFLLGTPASYVAFLSSCTQAIVAHVYNFQSVAGAFEYITDFDLDINLFGNTYKSTSIRIDGPKRKISVGMEVDEQDMAIYALPTDTIFGSTFLTGVESGLLDGCLVTRIRVVWPLTTGNVQNDVQTTNPIAAFTMFTGYMSEVQNGGQTGINFKVKSPLVKLETNMPRNYYQPGCLWTLYDAGCTLSQASFTFPFTVAAGGGGSPLAIGVGSIANPTSADLLPTYGGGRLLFTSGANNGLLTLIDRNDSAIFYLAYPLTTPPKTGDTFNASYGCSKSFATCNLKFNNTANFRGFDRVPPVAISI